MLEKLSARKVYRNAYRYVISHQFAFIFLTIFYFLGSLLPMVLGSSSFKIISLIYIYLFFYFAAGCYFKQRILLDKDIFWAAGMRFITAVMLFLSSIFLSSLIINFVIYVIQMIFPASDGLFDIMFDSMFGLLGKYVFIFLLFVAFFMIPSFAFVSEITCKNRSVLMAYAKTKGNFLRIAAVTAAAFVLLLLTMICLTYVNVYLASLVRAAILVFISILYFKMYDFFYNLPQTKKQKKVEAGAEVSTDADEKGYKTDVPKAKAGRGKSKAQTASVSKKNEDDKKTPKSLSKTVESTDLSSKLATKAITAPESASAAAKAEAAKTSHKSTA